MRLTKEQKLEMVKKHLDKGFSFKELADEYHLETDKKHEGCEKKSPCFNI